VARTRAQRRRHTLLITVGLIVTLIVLVFARDVSRSAHGAAGARSSEDLSFGALANTLLTKENNFDGRLDQLFSQGTTLSRYALAARLNELEGELPGWVNAADQLRRPALAHDVNETLDKITQIRVEAYQTLLGNVAKALALPWSNVPSEVLVNPAVTLATTSQQWNVDRFALVKEPGLVHLDQTSSKSANYFAANGATVLQHAPALKLVRAISIGAVRVAPAPLPAGTGVLLLPPVTSVQLGVSVVNAGYDLQPVTLTIRVTPLNRRGGSFEQTLRTTLGPLQAYAFVPMSFRTAASERARVVLTLSGAPTASGKVTSETYRMEMSPSGNT
jgi:hypothetical protein